MSNFLSSFADSSIFFFRISRLKESTCFSRHSILNPELLQSFPSPFSWPWKMLLLANKYKMWPSFSCVRCTPFFIWLKDTLSEVASFWPKTFLLRAPPSIFFEECVLFLGTEPRYNVWKFLSTWQWNIFFQNFGSISMSKDSSRQNLFFSSIHSESRVSRVFSFSVFFQWKVLFFGKCCYQF